MPLSPPPDRSSSVCCHCCSSSALALRCRRHSNSKLCIFFHPSCRFLRFMLLLSFFLACFRSFRSFRSTSVLVFFYASHRCIRLRGALQLRFNPPATVFRVRLSRRSPKRRRASRTSRRKFSRDMYTRFGTGSNFFLALLVHRHHFTLETFSIHLWIIFTFAPRDSHDHFQVASITSLLGGFPPNSSRQPNAVSISHDDLRRRRFDTQIDAIPHARQLPERSSCSLPFPQDSFCE